jgi:tRNA pseudouridine55 synthase
MKTPRRPLHGVLLLDKPIGWSSNDALKKTKGLMRAEKAGHTGTLDPLATGVLPICFGAATKFAQAQIDADKSYRATLHLGVTRVGGDREGEVIDMRPVQASCEAIDAACRRFVGAIDQVPPMQSALKVDGKPLYAYARAGIEIDRAPRRVQIHALDIVECDHAHLVIDVVCSKGTYIRTLAQDIGAALGCGAHLAALRRTASGAFGIDDTITIDALAALDEAQRDALLKPCDTLLAASPAIRLDASEAGRFLTGLRRRVAAGDTPLVRVYGPAVETPDVPRALSFLGSAHVHAGELIPDRLLSPPEIMALAPIPL